MSNSLWTTLKKIGINLVPIRPTNPLLHSSVHGYPIKKMYSVLPCVWAKRTREKKRYTLAGPCYYSLSRSRSFRNCHLALLLCLFAMELKVFFVCCSFLVLFLMLSSASILTIIILICMHARFSQRKISYPWSDPFIRRPFTITPIYLSI